MPLYLTVKYLYAVFLFHAFMGSTQMPYNWYWWCHRIGFIFSLQVNFVASSFENYSLKDYEIKNDSSILAPESIFIKVNGIEFNTRQFEIKIINLIRFLSKCHYIINNCYIFIRSTLSNWQMIQRIIDMRWWWWWKRTHI